MEQVGRLLIARGHQVSASICISATGYSGASPPGTIAAESTAGGPTSRSSSMPIPITHLLLLGDQRPHHHRIAIEEAKARGAEIICAELGYLRPDWLVLERDGMSTFSRMPRDPQTIRTLAQELRQAGFYRPFPNAVLAFHHCWT